MDEDQDGGVGQCGWICGGKGERRIDHLIVDLILYIQLLRGGDKVDALVEWGVNRTEVAYRCGELALTYNGKSCSVHAVVAWHRLSGVILLLTVSW